MPLILDNPMAAAGDMQVDIGVDDLFGDAPLALQNRPPSKRLLLRLSELRSRGSCQGLAWSKTGSIASIAPDGRSLELRYIRADPKDATWGLSEPTTCTPWQNLAGGPIVHLAWAPTQGSELAIIDAVGRVLMVNFGTNVNTPSPAARSWDKDPLDDTNAVVGTYWLPSYPAHRGQANHLHAPAVKEGNNYNYEHSIVVSHPPYHPNPAKSAFFCITTVGLLKMFWAQNITSKIEESSLELESVTSSDDLITHAAMVSDTRVAMATSSKQLQVVQVVLNWGMPSQENMKGGLPQNQTLNPSLMGRPVAISTWLPGGPSESHLDAAMTRLSLLEFIPTTFDSASRTWHPPLVVTVRSFVPTPDTPYNQETQSVIDTWEVILNQDQTMHHAFENLGSRRNSTGSSPSVTQRLKRLDPIIVNKIIIGITVVRMGTVVCFSYSDGTVEYRDRITMNEVWTAPKLDRINSVHEAGFTHSGEPSCLQTAVSPTLFSLVQMCEDGKIKWHGVNYTLSDPASMDDAQYRGVIAALTMSTAQLAATQSNVDDILATARQFIGKERFAQDWVTEIVRMMRIAVDYSEEAHHDALVRNQLLQMCFSTLSHFGWNGNFQPRAFSGKMAMFALNLRNIVILITIASNGHMKERTPLDEPEVVDALATCCKWSIDLLCWITDSLFCLLDDQKFQDLLKQPSQYANMNPYLHSKNDISLHMVLSSPIRGLLSAVCRRMAHLHHVSQRAISYYEARNLSSDPNSRPSGSSLALHQAYRKMLGYTSSALVNVNDFEQLLGSLSKSIRQQYTESFGELGKRAAAEAVKKNPNAPKNIAEEAVKRAQSHCELTMLLAGSPPSTLAQVIHRFFTNDLTAFRAQCDPASLFFANYDILEVDDDPKLLTSRKQRGVRVDLFKRVEITPKKKTTGAAGEDMVVPWRRCVRCASVMEDEATMKPELKFVLSQQRNCSCGGRLALLGKDELNE
ncbi:hypothetical protein JX265_010244 [Neoarthrinium moseri]|uniref:Mediator of RNA polymerase II transcription subunit 16 n=1 Tax=Neoarthrinium moseri TaxID=1658444 RepID=A0A9P9WEV9_9PEZI|nr:hypothetical protein JX265_010244 [Neoarthrinium moseri]